MVKQKYTSCRVGPLYKYPTKTVRICTAHAHSAWAEWMRLCLRASVAPSQTTLCVNFANIFIATISLIEYWRAQRGPVNAAEKCHKSSAHAAVCMQTQTLINQHAMYAHGDEQRIDLCLFELSKKNGWKKLLFFSCSC